MIDSWLRPRCGRLRHLAGLLGVVLMSFSVTACGAGEAPAGRAVGASSVAAQPQDVRDFIARRRQCDHFRGEEASDAKRQAMLDAKLKEFCTGSDAQLAALKKKYSADKAVTKELSTFDAQIE